LQTGFRQPRNKLRRRVAVQITCKGHCRAAGAMRRPGRSTAGSVRVHGAR
jgi:hypothetical protein